MKKNLFVSDCFFEKPVEKYPLQSIPTPVCTGREEGRRGVRVKCYFRKIESKFIFITKVRRKVSVAADYDAGVRGRRGRKERGEGENGSLYSR